MFLYFPQENSCDFEPITAALSFAVQKCLQQALTQGLALSISKFLSLELPSFDDVGFTGLLNLCTTASYFAHLSENGSKLRSKRRSHLRIFVVDSRYRACWNCLVLMKTCFLEQPSVLVQEMLKNGMWFKCFENLFTPSFLEKYLYTSTSAQSFNIQIVAMFYELSSKLLPMVRSIRMHVACSSYFMLCVIRRCPASPGFCWRICTSLQRVPSVSIPIRDRYLSPATWHHVIRKNNS